MIRSELSKPIAVKVRRQFHTRSGRPAAEGVADIPKGRRSDDCSLSRSVISLDSRHAHGIRIDSDAALSMKVSSLGRMSSAGVFDISFAIGRGEFLAIIGASGPGKTTVLKLLVGFVKPDAGRVPVDGKNVGNLPPEGRKLGVAFQNYALYPHMRLWENVAYPLRVRGVANAQRKERAIERLGCFGMANRAETLPTMLSGGQQQRAALAKAFVFEPRGLLLDEPLWALDASLRVGARDEILKIQCATLARPGLTGPVSSRLFWHHIRTLKWSITISRLRPNRDRSRHVEE
jgi:ABC-type nitrate/sulfonate/bicarbonate transport system ATPase subunit